MASTRFIVVGVQRTGTTLIRTTLDNHSRITCAGEIFKTRGLRRKPHLGPWSYTAHLDAMALGKVRDLVFRRTLVTAFLDDLYASDVDAIGFKLMRDQSQRFPMVVPYVREHGVRVIHVVRENTLKTYVSILTARVRGFHSREKVAQVRIEVPASDLLQRLEGIEADSRAWADTFADGHPYLAVTYEGFVAERERALAEVCEFLDVPVETPESHLRKMTSDNLRDVIENYDEVLERLRGTRWESCLGVA